MQIVVNVSDARVSADVADTLVTYSLGSCIGVCLWDPVRKIAGMLHYQLPTSTLDAAKAAANPNMFADTGMNYLLGEMNRLGAEKKRLKVKLAGAAQMFDDKGVFDIGRRNHTAIRKILWQHGMFVECEQVGGTSPRTLYFSVADGSVVVKSGQQQMTI